MARSVCWLGDSSSGASASFRRTATASGTHTPSSKRNHSGRIAETDQAIGALLEDLEQRGLLDTTLVIWGGEFGRMPVSQAGDGRDHNPDGFLIWMAGGGVKGGVSHGATDDIGYKAVEGRVSVNDIHATILHLLGLNHTRLTYEHNGRR